MRDSKHPDAILSFCFEAVAAVDSLAWYLDLEKVTDTAKLAWAIGFPLMFVASLVMLSLSDRLGRHDNKAE